MVFKRFAIALIAALFLVLATRGVVLAQSNANLQADIYQLRSEVSQLRAQVNSLSRQGGSRASTPPPTSRPRGAEMLTDRQLLDRLATLAIEAKDRLSALENRVAKLEKQAK